MLTRLAKVGFSVLVLASGPIAVTAAAPAVSAQGRFTHACSAPRAAAAACNALVRSGITSSAVNPAGYHPADLQAAYSLPSSTAGSGQMVAIVDAFDDPNAASDLSTYRSNFGLPACTTSNGCFRKVSEQGKTRYARANVGWGEEISLDLDMVSAICPNCHILLVEATTNSMTDLGASVNEAVKLGATEISNSYGAGESTTDTSYDSTYYHHPGVAITASTGDSGYGVQYPAASQYVTAVGGTSLLPDSSVRGWSETAWSGAGSGCSVLDPQPSWQNIPAGICSNRAVADVAAVADPNTGVAVYDSYNEAGWMEFGGTSVASPIIASAYALAGNASTVKFGSYPYSHTSSLFDITSGSTGACAVSALCTAGAGWDGPTGLGTPDGVGAF
jgi:subtilase family serine protease